MWWWKFLRPKNINYQEIEEIRYSPDLRVNLKMEWKLRKWGPWDQAVRFRRGREGGTQSSREEWGARQLGEGEGKEAREAEERGPTAGKVGREQSG